MITRLAFTIGCALLLSTAAVRTAAAQSLPTRAPAIAVIGGVTQYDLSGTGTRRFAAVRAQLPLLRHFVVEPGIGYMNYRRQGLAGLPRDHLWFPEVQLQAELPLGSVRPYLGAGAGGAISSFGGERSVDLTASVAGGLRVSLTAGWGAGAELRVRAIDPFHGNTADWGISLSRRL